MAVLTRAARDLTGTAECRITLRELCRSPPSPAGPLLRLRSSHDVVAQATLRDATDRVVAVLDVHWPRDVPRASAVHARLVALVQLCGPLLATAIAPDASRRSTRRADPGSLPEPAAVGGLDLSAVSWPACDDLPFGGDWTDAIRLGTARTAMLIGDVVGHDAAAALLMLRVREVLTAAIRTDPRPGTVFARSFDHLVALGKPFLGTAALFTFDTAEDTVEFATAGHPPALLRTLDGEVVRLTGGRGPALGLSAEAFPSGRRPFPSGSTLLAYTDGLVESRDQDIDAGIDRIADALRGLPAGPPPAAGQILDHVLRAASRDHRNHDDAAAFVISRT